MKTYSVTVEAVVRKTYTIEADSEDEAAELANEQFSVLPEDGIDEYYDQQVEEIELVDVAVAEFQGE